MQIFTFSIAFYLHFNKNISFLFFHVSPEEKYIQLIMIKIKKYIYIFDFFNWDLTK